MLLSCSKDSVESDVKPIPNELIGKWKATYAVADVVDIDQNGNPILLYLSNQYVIHFKANGTFTSNEFTEYTGGTYSYIETGYYDNIRLIYVNESGTLISYKTLESVDNNSLVMGVSIDHAFSSSALFPKEGFIRIE